jgi:hypothetical protein
MSLQINHERFQAAHEAFCQYVLQESGEPYQTLLNPPPADPRVAHPPRNAAKEA